MYIRDMTMSSSPTDGASRIPVTLQRASSLRLKGERYHHRTHHQDLFAAITENATDSSSCCNETTPRKPLPLKRSSSVNIFFFPPLLLYFLIDAVTISIYHFRAHRCEGYAATRRCITTATPTVWEVSAVIAVAIVITRILVWTVQPGRQDHVVISFIVVRLIAAMILHPMNILHPRREQPDSCAMFRYVKNNIH